MGLVDTCVACGAELGVGRFCLNCGHRIGAPAPAVLVAPDPVTDRLEADESPGQPADQPAEPAPEPAAEPSLEPTAMPVQAADPTPVPPVSPPVSPPDVSTEDGAPAAPATRAATVPPPALAPDEQSEWDPNLDLLPYEEVDDPDGEALLRGNAWIAWVVGALLLVALVLLLLQVFGTDGDEVATDPTGGDTSAATSEATPAPEETAPEETAPEGTEAPRGVGKRLELATGASVEVPGTAPPTTDFDGNLVAYEGAQMRDGNPSTTWRTAGDATGQTVTLTLAQPSVVNRVGLVNGYAKQVAGVDWYPNNRRILAVTWGFDDGTTVEQTFAERPSMQLLKVPPVATGTVTITLTSVTPPGSGNLGRDYTAISEVSIIGRRAG